MMSKAVTFFILHTFSLQNHWHRVFKWGKKPHIFPAKSLPPSLQVEKKKANQPHDVFILQLSSSVANCWHQCWSDLHTVHSDPQVRIACVECHHYHMSCHIVWQLLKISIKSSFSSQMENFQLMEPLLCLILRSLTEWFVDKEGQQYVPFQCFINFFF